MYMYYKCTLLNNLNMAILEHLRKSMEDTAMLKALLMKKGVRYSQQHTNLSQVL